MRNFFSAFLLMLLFNACSSSEDYQPQEIEFNIDYVFSSGDMTRATNAEIYDSFHKNHIASRKLTPDNFMLVFTNKETGQRNEVNGLWSRNGLIRLTEGTYTVTGDSYDGASNVYTKEKAVLSFNDEIVINRSTKSVILKASYNCPLLFFSSKNTQSIVYDHAPTSYTSESLPIVDEYYYCFIKSLSKTDGACFIISRKDNTKVRVYTKNLILENGKYYFFDDITGGFDLPPMVPGN